MLHHSGNGIPMFQQNESFIRMDQCGHLKKGPNPRVLACSKDYPAISGSNIDIKYQNHVFATDCPCAYDGSGKCRQKPHMCTATKWSYFCDIRIINTIVSADGGLIDCESLYPISFKHSTMGQGDPLYYKGIHEKWQAGYSDAIQKFNRNKPAKLPVYDYVVPARMRWDDCFNHLSFQSLPLIAHVREFRSDIWDKLTWHASLFTAALLRLLNVPEERIVIGKPIFARNIVLPWLQNWCPPQISSLHGISARVSREMTATLLATHDPTHAAPSSSSKKLLSEMELLPARLHVQLLSTKTGARRGSRIKNSRRSSSGSSNNSLNDTTISPYNSNSNNNMPPPVIPKGKRLVIYMSRPFKSVRGVANEAQIVSLLRKYVRPEYEVVTTGLTPEYQSVEALHDSWARSAAVFSRARVIIGPHGGAFNNIMWVPDDVDVVEFNEFPDDDTHLQSHGKTPVRSVFLTAAWARGITGKFWIVPPSRKHPFDFYVGKMRIAPIELFQVLTKIGDILQPNFTLSVFATEQHGTWEQPNPCFTCVPPPV